MRSLANEILAAMPGTRDQISAASGAARITVSRQVRALHAAGRCRIVRWVRPPKGPLMPVFARGPGEDTPARPPLMTYAEKSRRYRARRDAVVAGPFDSLFQK